MKVKHSFLALGLLFVLTASLPATARDRKDGNDNNKQRTEQMATRIAENMKLDEETTAWFKPLYVTMQDTLRAVRRPANAQTNAQTKPDELTDLQAAALIEDQFVASEKEIAIKRAYYKQFCERISPKLLLQIFGAQAPRDRQDRRGNGQQQGGFPPQGGGFPGGFPGGGDF